MRGVALHPGQPLFSAGRGVGLPGPYVSGSAAGGVSVAQGASNSTGAWVQLIASTAAESNWFTVTLLNTFVNAAAAPALMDIGIGAAASEVAVVSSIACGQIASSFWHHMIFPLRIPPASRVACRLTNAHATPPTATVRCELDAAADKTMLSPTKLVAVGADVANSKGVDVAGTDTWTQITAATTEPFQGLLLTYGGNDSSVSGATVTISLGVGASGSEVTIDSHATQGRSVEDFNPGAPLMAVARHIPTGTRIAAKVSAGDMTFTVVVQGIRYS